MNHPKYFFPDSLYCYMSLNAYGDFFFSEKCKFFDFLLIICLTLPCAILGYVHFLFILIILLILPWQVSFHFLICCNCFQFHVVKLVLFYCRVAGHPLAQNERCLHMFLQEQTIDKNYVPGKIRNTWNHSAPFKAAISVIQINCFVFSSVRPLAALISCT